MKKRCKDLAKFILDQAVEDNGDDEENPYAVKEEDFKKVVSKYMKDGKPQEPIGFKSTRVIETKKLMLELDVLTPNGLFNRGWLTFASGTMRYVKTSDTKELDKLYFTEEDSLK